MPNATSATSATSNYSPKGKEQEIYNALKIRIRELQNHRKNIGNKNIEKLWRKADEESIPDEYKDRDLKDWQSKQRGALAFEKINTALSVILDQNPEVVLVPTHNKWQIKNNFIKGLYDHSWSYKNNGPLAISLFTHNLAKYGFSIGRHYHRYEEREIQDIMGYDPSTNEFTYQKKTILDFNDPWTEILNPYRTWIDDMATPEKFARDWSWSKVYAWDDFQARFTKKRFTNINKVSPGGDTNTTSLTAEDKKTSKDLIEVIFYESAQKDSLRILAGGIDGTMVTPVNSPLPYHHKRLSCFYGYWYLRNANTPYGVGIPEIMRGDNKLIDLINNMSVDQLVLSIYKMFFYSPANDFSEDQYNIEPMKGIPTNDPSAIKFLEIPGPGREVLEWLDRLEKRIEDSTGITKTIGGEALGKTAFEARQNLEAGLRRLREPLRNIENAFEVEGNLRLDMIQQIYTIPKALKIIDEEEMQEFQEDRQKNPDLYFEEEGQLKRVEYRSVPLPFQKNAQGAIEPTEEDQILEITPEMIRWEGELRVKPMSTIVKSVEYEAEKALRIYNLMINNPFVDAHKASKRVLVKNQESIKDWLLSDDAIIERQTQAEGARNMGFGMKEIEAMGPASKVTRDQNIGFTNPTPGVLSQLFKK